MGIFKTDSDTFTTYQVAIQVRDRLMGGVPKDPRVIEGWLKKRAEIDDIEDLRRAVLRTVQELGADVPADASYEDLDAALTQIAGEKGTNGFKRDEAGIYIEGRQLKSMLRECVSILFSGEKRGRTKKSARSFFNERVFVNPDRVHLGLAEPSGIDLFIGHTTGPRGPQSNLTYIEYAERPLIAFEIMVLHDEVEAGDWPEIWNLAEENGLGALRSQGFGRFDLTRFDAAGVRRLEAVS